MNKKQFIKNRPFTASDSAQMQDWIETSIKENIRNVFTFGVLDGLNIESNNNFTVKVKAGKALDSQYNYIKLDSDVNINIDPAHASLNRIDLITIKFMTQTTDNIDTTNEYGRGTSWVYSRNLLDRYEIKVIKGTNATSPVMPSIPAGELALASLYIGAAQGSIGNSNITDRRSIAQFINKPIVSTTLPVGTFKEGQVWHNPSSLDTQMLVNGQFRPVGGIPPVISNNEPTQNLKEGLIWYNPDLNTIKFYLDGNFQTLQSSTAILPYENSVVLDVESEEVSHGIAIFQEDRDVMFVYKNTVHLQKDVDYQISEDGKKIISLKGPWEEGTQFDFMVLYSSPLTDALNTIRLTNSYTAVGGESNVNIGISEFNMETDLLDVFYTNSSYTDRYQLFQGLDYNIVNNGRISLRNIVLSQNERIHFYVWKKVRIQANLTDGSLIENNSISNDKLASDIKIGNLADLTTTIKTSIVAAINEVRQSLNTHINNSNIHVTSGEKSSWNNHIQNNAIHITQEEKNMLHTHTNKQIIDSLTDNNGQLNYKGGPIGNPNAVNKSGDTITGVIDFNQNTAARLVLPVGVDKWATQ